MIRTSLSNKESNTELCENFWSGSYGKSKKKRVMLNRTPIRLDSFVKLIIHVVFFLIISCDNSELYIKNFDKNSSNVEFYLFNLFKSNRLRFSSVSASAKGTKLKTTKFDNKPINSAPILI